MFTQFFIFGTLFEYPLISQFHKCNAASARRGRLCGHCPLSALSAPARRWAGFAYTRVIRLMEHNNYVEQ